MLGYGLFQRVLYCAQNGGGTAEIDFGVPVGRSRLEVIGFACPKKHRKHLRVLLVGSSRKKPSTCALSAMWLDYTRPQAHGEQFWRRRSQRGATAVQHNRRTPTVVPARRPPKKDDSVLETRNLAKQLSELRQ